MRRRIRRIRLNKAVTDLCVVARASAIIAIRSLPKSSERHLWVIHLNRQVGCMPGLSFMEITRTFANTYGDMMRAKMRLFFRRSVYRYAIAVALITFGLHAKDPALTSADKLIRGVGYFFALCLFVLSIYAVVALAQSRRITPRTITFTGTRLIVNHNGELSDHGWDWIISAGESPRLISLLVQRMPRLELYLPKRQLNKIEYDVLRSWLVLHGKLQKHVARP